MARSSATRTEHRSLCYDARVPRVHCSREPTASVARSSKRSRRESSRRTGRRDRAIVGHASSTSTIIQTGWVERLTFRRTFDHSCFLSLRTNEISLRNTNSTIRDYRRRLVGRFALAHRNHALAVRICAFARANVNARFSSVFSRTVVLLRSTRSCELDYPSDNAPLSAARGTLLLAAFARRLGGFGSLGAYPHHSRSLSAITLPASPTVEPLPSPGAALAIPTPSLDRLFFLRVRGRLLSRERERAGRAPEREGNRGRRRSRRTEGEGNRVRCRPFESANTVTRWKKRITGPEEEGVRAESSSEGCVALCDESAPWCPPPFRRGFRGVFRVAGLGTMRRRVRDEAERQDSPRGLSILNGSSVCHECAASILRPVVARPLFLSVGPVRSNAKLRVRDPCFRGKPAFFSPGASSSSFESSRCLTSLVPRFSSTVAARMGTVDSIPYRRACFVPRSSSARRSRRPIARERTNRRTRRKKDRARATRSLG